jgi:hypothetical protein
MLLRISRQQHLRHAALLWVAVGLMLCVRGFLWIHADAHTRGKLIVLLPVALILGLAKGWAMLRKPAANAVARIYLLDTHTPIWRLFSAATYRLIGCMILLGVVARFIGAYYHIGGAIGTLYGIVGVGLITASSIYWRAVPAVPAT